MFGRWCLASSLVRADVAWVSTGMSRHLKEETDYWQDTLTNWYFAKFCPHIATKSVVQLSLQLSVAPSKQSLTVFAAKIQFKHKTFFIFRSRNIRGKLFWNKHSMITIERSKIHFWAVEHEALATSTSYFEIRWTIAQSRCFFISILDGSIGSGTHPTNGSAFI